MKRKGELGSRQLLRTRTHSALHEHEQLGFFRQTTCLYEKSLRVWTRCNTWLTCYLLYFTYYTCSYVSLLRVALLPFNNKPTYVCVCVNGHFHFHKAKNLDYKIQPFYARCQQLGCTLNFSVKSKSTRSSKCACVYQHLLEATYFIGGTYTRTDVQLVQQNIQVLPQWRAAGSYDWYNWYSFIDLICSISFSIAL